MSTTINYLNNYNKSNKMICLQSRHDNLPLNYVCISNNCLGKGLVCQSCVNDHHKQHNILPLKIFLNTFKEQSKLNHALSTLKRDSKLLTDLSIELSHYFDSFSKSLSDIVIEAKKRILTNIECDKELIQSVLEVEQKHGNLVEELERDAQDQEQQMSQEVAQEKILNLISRINSNQNNDNNSRFSVSSFRDDNQKSILLLLRKSNSIKNNIFSETPKFAKDLYMYLKQIDNALEAYDNKRSNSVNVSQLEQSASYRSVSPMQGFSYQNKLQPIQQSDLSPPRSASGSRQNIFARQPASNRMRQTNNNNNGNINLNSNHNNINSSQQPQNAALLSPFKIGTDVSENYNISSDGSKLTSFNQNNLVSSAGMPKQQLVVSSTNEFNQKNEDIQNIQKNLEQNTKNIFNIQEQFYPHKREVNNNNQIVPSQSLLQQPLQDVIVPVSYTSNKKPNLNNPPSSFDQISQPPSALKKPSSGELPPKQQQQLSSQNAISGSAQHSFQSRPQGSLPNPIIEPHQQLMNQDKLQQQSNSNINSSAILIKEEEIEQMPQKISDDNISSNPIINSINLKNNSNNNSQYMRGRSYSNNNIKQFYQQSNNQPSQIPSLQNINQHNYITPQQQNQIFSHNQQNKNDNTKKSTSKMNIYAELPQSNEDLNKIQNPQSNKAQVSPQSLQPQALLINTSSPLLNNFSQSKSKQQNDSFMNKSHISYMQQQHSPNNRINTNPSNKSLTNIPNSPVSNTSYLDHSRVAYNQNSLSQLMAHDGNIHCIELMGNDKIASGSADKLIKIWERMEYKLLNTLEGHNASVTVLKYHSMSRILVSGGDDDLIIVWKPVPLLSKVHVLQGHEDTITSLIFQNERILISCSKDLKMIVWDIEKGIGKNKLDQSDTIINDMTIYNKMIMSVSDKYVQFWELSTYKLIKKVEAHDDVVNQISLIHRKRKAQIYIVTCGNDGCIYVWDGDNKYDEVDKIEEEKGWNVQCFDYNSHYDLIVYGCRSKNDSTSKVVVYSLELKKVTQVISYYPAHINQIKCLYKDIYIALDNFYIDNLKIQKNSSIADY